MPVDDDIRNRVRVRVNGLVVRDQALLMVNLHSPVTNELIWMPPGGGLGFGETLHGALVREIKEETGVTVEAGPLWYLQEVHATGIHAVEFYFFCHYKAGEPVAGVDPEYSKEQQIIRGADFIPFDRLGRSDIFPEYLRNGFAEDLSDPERQKELPGFI
nr:NUDIX domain-containing protein [Natronogracilivirga saccharolytica]